MLAEMTRRNRPRAQRPVHRTDTFKGASPRGDDHAGGDGCGWRTHVEGSYEQVVRRVQGRLLYLSR
jgi:hypothetical protein